MQYLGRENIPAITIYLLGASLFSVLFSYFLSSLFLALSFVLSIYLFDYKRLTQQKILLWLVISMPFVLTIFSALPSFNFDKGMEAVVKRLPIFIIPFIFIALGDIKRWHFRNILILFGLGCALANILGIAKGLIFFLDTNLFFEPNYLFYLFPVQHVYLATYSVFVLIETIINYQDYNKKHKKSLLVINVINILGFFLLSSKMALFILIVTLISIVFSKYSKVKSALMLLLLFCVFGMVFVYFEPFLSRFIALFDGEEPRLVIWDCAWRIIKSNAFLDFIPIGDMQDRLNHCYYSSTAKLSLEGFAAHNQYLEFWITNGFFGLVFYLISLTILFRHAILRKKNIMRYFIVIILLFGITECIFSRQYGIMFYATLMGLFTFSKR